MESLYNECLAFVDCSESEPEEVLVLVRAYPDFVHLGLSRRKHGDIEIGITPDECEKVLETLRIAIVAAREKSRGSKPPPAGSS
jgi:hypothetical protein